jgi:hypothetical protein
MANYATAVDYQRRLYYLHTLAGPKIIEYLDKLRLGEYCEEEKQNLIDVHWGMIILNEYDTSDIALAATTNNKRSLVEMEKLMDIVYLKLL